MVSSLPGGGLILFGCQFPPFFTFPIKDVDWVISDFIGPASSKYDDAIILLIVVEGAVGARRRHMTDRLDFAPFHGDCIKRPEIVHIGWVCVIWRGTCVTTEEDNFILYDAAAVSPSSIWNGVVYAAVSNLLPWYLFHWTILLEFYKKSIFLSIISTIYTQYLGYRSQQRLFHKKPWKILLVYSAFNLLFEYILATFY